MKVDGKSRERLWLLALVAALALVVGGPAYAQQGVMQNLKDSFELHGYVENQEIIRSTNYETDYNVASIRNRIDIQPSGQIIKDVNLPTVMGLPLGTGLSVNYFAEIRPGYEGVYDLVTDRFGNHTTGWSGIGFSPFRTLGGSGTSGFLSFFCGKGQTSGPGTFPGTQCYDPRRFKGVVARDLAFNLPVSQNVKFINNINGVPTECWNCINVEQTVANLRFERDDSNLIYYPAREAYLDFRWDFFGSNLLRAGKQQVV